MGLSSWNREGTFMWASKRTDMIRPLEIYLSSKGDECSIKWSTPQLRFEQPSDEISLEDEIETHAGLEEYFEREVLKAPAFKGNLERLVAEKDSARKHPLSHEDLK